jgi:dTDP-4-amino-4,6-dideoxygalactose transaminase
MSKYEYCPWPLGKVAKEHQRTELDTLSQNGYVFNDPREVVDLCEKKIADFFGAKYCVTVDCCSHAIFLSLQYLRAIMEIEKYDEIIVPKQTYISVPMQVIHAGLEVRFKDIVWIGYYNLTPTRVIDAAVMWERNSYIQDSLMCLSFQIKKMIPTGKMGAILTDDLQAFEWLKLASYDGRDLTLPYDDANHVQMIGWHMYATPEDCARTVWLMDNIKKEGRYMGHNDYPDVSKMFKYL